MNYKAYNNITGQQRVEGFIEMKMRERNSLATFLGECDDTAAVDATLAVVSEEVNRAGYDSAAFLIDLID